MHPHNAEKLGGEEQGRVGIEYLSAKDLLQQYREAWLRHLRIYNAGRKGSSYKRLTKELHEILSFLRGFIGLNLVVMTNRGKHVPAQRPNK